MDICCPEGDIDGHLGFFYRLKGSISSTVGFNEIHTTLSMHLTPKSCFSVNYNKSYGYQISRETLTAILDFLEHSKVKISHTHGFNEILTPTKHIHFDP